VLAGKNAVLIFIVISVCLYVAPDLCAQVNEYYAGFKIKTKIERKYNISLNLKQETRYRNSAHYYSKTFIGLSKNVRPDVEISLFYALQKIKKNAWKQKHMVWAEANVKRKLNFIRWESCTKLERHATAKFWRLREKIKIISPLYSEMSLFVGDEVRYFFRDSRIGENEILFGFLSPVVKNFKIELFYDVRRFFIEGYLDDADCMRIALNFML